MAAKSKVAPATVSKTTTAPLDEVAAIKAALPKGSSLSVVIGGRGCPEGFARVSVVDLE